jgi:hypothetical protein
MLYSSHKAEANGGSVTVMRSTSKQKGSTTEEQRVKLRVLYERVLEPGSARGLLHKLRM